MAVQTSEKLSKKIESLPRRPGVYLMKDARHEVIYVGKAKDLRARVRSYYQEGGDDWRLISKRMDRVADVDAVVTASEKEALLLESNFIKQFRPKYNVYFRDDKSFVSIKIGLSEQWPRPIVTRRLDDPGALYFGPYASAKAARKTLRVLQDVFPLRKCSIRECMERSRPCLYWEMGKCLAPCCAEVSEEEYGRILDLVVMFLKGKGEDVLAELRREMDESAKALQYERAARMRDRIRAIETTLEGQRVAASAADVDRDVFGLCALDRYVSAAVLFVRNGNIQDVASYRFPADLDSESAIFGSFLNQFYSANRFIPQEILVPVETEDAELLESWLAEQRGRKVRLIRPLRGPKRRLVELANGNARQAERAATTRQEKRRLEMESLQRILGLTELPRNIECFDISTLQGREAVGSMVVFREGEPDKASYRHYKIRDVEGQDDFAMMREVLSRRYGKLAAAMSAASAAEEGEGHGDALPELALVDGGKGQLAVAVQVLGELEMDSCDVAALAKARSGGGTKLKAERVFLPGQAEPIEVPEDSSGFRLITRVRDEAHRFAVGYHRKLRLKATMQSPLVEIGGIGRKMARRLLDHFGGLNKVKEATVEELRQVKGISDVLARAIYEHYRGRGRV
ncbi:MAG: excinuclease ABC subunit UvrC [Candidatus Brocadiae bacterium]|nr:excinuclease ABC subunit UvrC [Candidatus Brocadiia bacterium]